MSPRFGWFILLLAGLSATPGPPPHAAPDDGKRLVVSGRVADRDGWPIERAKITVRGDRSGSASTDASGRFSLIVPLGSPAALARGAFEFAIEARAGGGRLALSDGARELRLAFRVIGEPGEDARVEVRASQAEAAAEVVRAFAQAGPAAATLVLVFGPATPAADGPAGLSAREEAPLTGVKVPGSRPVVSGRATPDTVGAAVRLREARARTGREREAAELEARERDAREKQRSEKAARGPQRLQKETAARAAREQQRLQKEAAAKAGRVRPPTEKPAGEMSTREKPEGDRTAREKPEADTPRVAERPAGKPEGASTTPVKPAPVKPAPPSARNPAPRTSPAEGIGTRKSTAVAPPPAVATRTAPAPCGCRIEGTIEVQSDRPLSRRLPLILRLRDQPACRDTVELFMGSPRVFEITGAGCGSHVIDVEIPERERFRLANSERERTVSCVRGVLRQFRLILLPR